MTTLFFATVSDLDVFSMLSTAHGVPLTNRRKLRSTLIGLSVSDTLGGQNLPVSTLYKVSRVVLFMTLFGILGPSW